MTPTYDIVPVKTVEDRIGRIWRAVTFGVADPVVRVLVAEMIAECRRGDRGCELDNIFGVIRELVTYRDDPAGMDLFQTLRRSIRSRTGDCGSFTAAYDTCLSAIGMPVGACVIAQNGSDDWDHVYSLTKIRGGKRLTLDGTDPMAYVGWEPEHHRWWARRDYWYDAEAWMDWYRRGASDRMLPPIRYTDEVLKPRVGA